jgi:hypothetical protein
MVLVNLCFPLCSNFSKKAQVIYAYNSIYLLAGQPIRLQEDHPTIVDTPKEIVRPI